MSDLKLTLLGQPNLQQNGQPIELKSRKGWALLAYLILTPTPVSRETVATLFWPEHDPTAARRNLRRLLYTLNQSPLQPYLQTPNDLITLQWTGEIDVAQFLTSIAQEEWGTAVSLYQGELLTAIHISDSNPFETWLTAQREQLRQKMLHALTALTDSHLTSNNFTAAETTVRHQLSLDNWNEHYWRRLMTILAHHGRPAQALAAFQTCRQLLKKELNTPPAPETVTLFEAIRDGRFPAPPQPTTHYAVPPPRPLAYPHARQTLLNQMQTDWIDGVLHTSLHGNPYLTLDKKASPNAIAYPWTTLAQRPLQQRPHHTTQPIIDLFDNEGRALLILGEPGAGKTTTLLTLAAALISRAQNDAAHPLPLILPLATWQGNSLSDWISQEVNEKYHILPHITQEWLAHNHLLLLLDGLDELPLNRQPAAVTAINTFRQKNGLTPLVVCARQADYDALPTPLTLNAAIQLQPLTPAHIEAFFAQQPTSSLHTRIQQEKALTTLHPYPTLPPTAHGRRPHIPHPQLPQTPTKLFTLYLQQMMATPLPNGRPPNPQNLTHLRWLATQLTQHNHPIFLLDRLQPDWLASRWQIPLYFFLSRLIGGLILGTTWSFRDFGWESLPIGLFFGLLVASAELLLYFWLTPLYSYLRPLSRLSSSSLGRLP